MKDHIEKVREKCFKDILSTESGYKVFWPACDDWRKVGYLNAMDLRIIADYLDELNEEWDNQVNEDLNE